MIKKSKKLNFYHVFCGDDGLKEIEFYLGEFNDKNRKIIFFNWKILKFSYL